MDKSAGTGEQSTPNVVVTEVSEKLPSKKKAGLFDGNIPLGPLDFFLQFRWRTAVRNIFQNSPGWSVSLGVHVLLLIVLFVVSVGVVSQKPLSLTLEFLPEPGPPGPPAVVLPGVAPNSRLDTENLVQELAVSEKDVVEDPAAVPAMDRLVPDQESFAARPAEAIGSLLTGRQEGRRRSLLASGGGTDRDRSRRFSEHSRGLSGSKRRQECHMLDYGVCVGHTPMVAQRKTGSQQLPWHCWRCKVRVIHTNDRRASKRLSGKCMAINTQDAD